MHKLFSFIFLVVTLMASTVVISATEANIYSGVDVRQEFAAGQEGCAAGEGVPDGEPDKDDYYSDPNYNPGDNDTYDEGDINNNDAKDENDVNDVNANDIEENDVNDANNANDNDVNDADDDPVEDDPDEKLEDLPEDHHILPVYPDHQELIIITVTNYPVTVMPLGQSPAGTTVVQDGVSVNLFAGVAEGYIFSHWSYLSYGRYEVNFGNIFDVYTTFQANAGVITIIANWTASENSRDEGNGYIQITFDPNGGAWEDGDSNPITVTFPVYTYICGTIGIQLPENPLRPGHTFIGWNTQPDGNGEWFFGDDAVSDDDGINYYGI